MSNPTNKNQIIESEKKNRIPKNQSDIAKDVLRIIATSNLRLGDRPSIKEEDIKYKEATLQIMDLLFKHDVDLLEIELLFQLMKQAVVIFEGTVQGSLDISKNTALKEYWGKYPDELRMSDIEEKLKKIGEKNRQDK